jgi:hypothetical protein
MSLDVSLRKMMLVDVYSANITHNLGAMAKEAGLYKAIWRPDEINISEAGSLIAILAKGLTALKRDRERFEKFTPSNGWGDYDGLVEFVTDYLQACIDNPEAIVNVSR